MNKVFAAITVTAVALASTTVFAETAAAEKFAQVQQQFDQLDKDTNHGNPIEGLLDLFTAPVKAISQGVEADPA
ncbi:MAG: hypothetical protein AAF501_17360 [Pseudomonadota bacterium]